MSLAKITELQDLKDEAEKIINVRAAKFQAHRAAALVNVLSQMKAYLAGQGFSIVDGTGPNRGFTASYKGLEIKAKASKDDEEYFGSDYLINLTSGSIKAELDISVGRGEPVSQPISKDIDAQIEDYKSRFLPELRTRENEPFNQLHTLKFKLGVTNFQSILIKDGAEAIDKFSQYLA